MPENRVEYIREGDARPLTANDLFVHLMCLMCGCARMRARTPFLPDSLRQMRIKQRAGQAKQRCREKFKHVSQHAVGPIDGSYESPPPVVIPIIFYLLLTRSKAQFEASQSFL